MIQNYSLVDEVCTCLKTLDLGWYNHAASPWTTDCEMLRNAHQGSIAWGLIAGFRTSHVIVVCADMGFYCSIWGKISIVWNEWKLAL